MTQLHKIGVNLTQGQKSKLARAYRNNEGVTIRLANSALCGNDVLMVPSNTASKLGKIEMQVKECRLPYQRVTLENSLVVEFLVLSYQY